MPLSQSKLLVRVDTGIQIGTDRIRGIHALAREYRQHGGKTTIVCSEIPNSLRRRIEQDCITVLQTEQPTGTVSDCFATQEIIAHERPDWLAIDGAVFDASYLAQIATNIRRVLILDGISREHSNLSVDDSWDHSPVQPTNFGNHAQQPFEPELFSGPDYSLIDCLRSPQPINRKTVVEAKRILVWIHDADVDNWTLRTLQSLSDLATKRTTVDCLVGSNYEHFAELESFKRHSNVTLRIHKNLDRLAPLAERSDLAIASGHTGCYSLAYYGIPTILVPTAESNQNIIAALHQNRAALSIAHQQPATASSPTVFETIKNLLRDRFKRHSLSRHAMDLVDGYGANRIVDSMAKCSVSLRPAEDFDCELFWQWQNDPEVRAAALNQSPVAWTTLTDWFFDAQADSQQQIWVIENAISQPIGYIEFRLNDHGDQAETNMLFDQQHRNHNTKAMLIEIALEHLFATTTVGQVVAQTRSGNIEFEKSFRTAGFETIAPTIIDGVMASRFLCTRPQSQNQTGRSSKVA